MKGRRSRAQGVAVVALIVAGCYLLFPLGVALIVAGVLVLADHLTD